jgi:hypothetical protein
MIAPRHRGVVERESRLLLPAVLGLRGRERRRDLVNQPLPIAGVSRKGRRPKRDAVGPLDVLEPRIRLMFDLGAVPAPVLLRGDERLPLQLRDVAQPNLAAYRRRSIRHGASEPGGLLGRLSDESR